MFGRILDDREFDDLFALINGLVFRGGLEINEIAMGTGHCTDLFSFIFLEFRTKE